MYRGSLAAGAFALTAALGLWSAAPNAAAPANPQPPTFTKDVVPFLAKHCYACHGNGKKRGQLSLDQYKDDESLQKDGKTWQNVLQMIRSGAMPPKARPRPDEAEIKAVLFNIEGVLANVDCTKARNAGRVTLRRLNRAEYNNTIRDLVGVDFKPAADFPNDDVGYGFDNIGDVLSLSPLLLEKYLAAAESILDNAIVVADPPRPIKTRVGGFRFRPRAASVKRGGDLATSCTAKAVSSAKSTARKETTSSASKRLASKSATNPCAASWRSAIRRRNLN